MNLLNEKRELIAEARVGFQSVFEDNFFLLLYRLLRHQGHEEAQTAFWARQKPTKSSRKNRLSSTPAWSRALTLNRKCGRCTGTAHKGKEIASRRIKNRKRSKSGLQTVNTTRTTIMLFVNPRYPPPWLPPGLGGANGGFVK
jgi:hypothetical protein